MKLSCQRICIKVKLKGEKMSLFSDNLKKMREKRGYTHQELADLVGVNRVTYTNWENGNREPKFEKVIELAKVLKANTDYLLGFSDKNMFEMTDDELVIVSSPEVFEDWKSEGKIPEIAQQIRKNAEEKMPHDVLWLKDIMKAKINAGETLKDIEKWFSISPEDEGYDFILYIYNVARKEVENVE